MVSWYWMLIPANPVMNCVDYFRYTPVEVLVVSQFFGTNLCLKIGLRVFLLLSILMTPPPQINFETNYAKLER